MLFSKTDVIKLLEHHLISGEITNEINQHINDLKKSNEMSLILREIFFDQNQDPRIRFMSLSLIKNKEIFDDEMFEDLLNVILNVNFHPLQSLVCYVLGGLLDSNKFIPHILNLYKTDKLFPYLILKEANYVDRVVLEFVAEVLNNQEDITIVDHYSVLFSRLMRLSLDGDPELPLTLLFDFTKRIYSSEINDRVIVISYYVTKLCIFIIYEEHFDENSLNDLFQSIMNHFFIISEMCPLYTPNVHCICLFKYARKLIELVSCIVKTGIYLPNEVSKNIVIACLKYSILHDNLISDLLKSYDFAVRFTEDDSYNIRLEVDNLLSKINLDDISFVNQFFSTSVYHQEAMYFVYSCFLTSNTLELTDIPFPSDNVFCIASYLSIFIRCKSRFDDDMYEEVFNEENPFFLKYSLISCQCIYDCVYENHIPIILPIFLNAPFCLSEPDSLECFFKILKIFFFNNKYILNSYLDDVISVLISYFRFFIRNDYIALEICLIVNVLREVEAFQEKIIVTFTPICQELFNNSETVDVCVDLINSLISGINKLVPKKETQTLIDMTMNILENIEITYTNYVSIYEIISTLVIHGQNYYVFRWFLGNLYNYINQDIDSYKNQLLLHKPGTILRNILLNINDEEKSTMIRSINKMFYNKDEINNYLLLNVYIVVCSLTFDNINLIQDILIDNGISIEYFLNGLYYCIHTIKSWFDIKLIIVFLSNFLDMDIGDLSVSLMMFKLLKNAFNINNIKKIDFNNETISFLSFDPFYRDHELTKINFYQFTMKYFVPIEKHEADIHQSITKLLEVLDKIYCH